MAIDVSSIRTLQDVINVLSVVYFNMNEIERIYYDMFLNPKEMDVTFQRYDDEGVLETITLPNRAKDAQKDILRGNGSPEGVKEAGIGTFYIDLTTSKLYYKSQGIDAFGWIEIETTLSMTPGVDYLKPDGNASQLTDLNMTNAGSGVLSVLRGGTGSSNITGLVKGNGSSAFTTALDGVDYMGANSMTGVIAFYPTDDIPAGWLRCDGKAYSRTTYARLFGKIGTIYGEGDGSTTFNVPNLYNYFIRGWDGSSEFNTIQQDQVGKHTHAYSGITEEENEHTHTRGDMNITGTFPTIEGADGLYSGAFYLKKENVASKTDNTNGDADDQAGFNAANSWTGNTSGGSPHSHNFSGTTDENVTLEDTIETRVINKMLVPIIKY